MANPCRLGRGRSCRGNPAARYPKGSMLTPAPLSGRLLCKEVVGSLQSSRLIEPEHQVHALDCLAARAFTEVIGGRQDHGTLAGGLDADADLAVIGKSDAFHFRGF